jgi:hypothetical protein
MEILRLTKSSTQLQLYCKSRLETLFYPLADRNIRSNLENEGGAYLRGRGLVAPKREVPDEQRAWCASGHGAAVLEHEVERDGERGVVAVDDHGGGVPHEADVDARGVDVDRRGVVVGGDDGDGLPAAVLPAEGGHRHAPRRRGLLRARPPIDGRFRQVAQQPPRQLPGEEGPPHRVLVVRSGGARERGRETVAWLVRGGWGERWGREGHGRGGLDF